MFSGSISGGTVVTTANFTFCDGIYMVNTSDSYDFSIDFGIVVEIESGVKRLIPKSTGQLSTESIFLFSKEVPLSYQDLDKYLVLTPSHSLSIKIVAFYFT